MKKLEQISAQNMAVKKNLASKFTQLHKLLQQLQQESDSRMKNIISFQDMKKTVKKLQKCQQMAENISLRLIERQIQKNVSGDYKRILKVYESKINQCRLAIHEKENHYEEYHWDLDDSNDKQGKIKYTQQYVPPMLNFVRKFNIELLYKEKIQKLLISLSQLSLQKIIVKTSNNYFSKQLKQNHKRSQTFTNDDKTAKFNNKTTRILHHKKQITPAFILMYDSLQAEQKRYKELQQKYMIYRNVLSIVNRENRELIQSIDRRKILELQDRNNDQDESYSRDVSVL